MLQLKPKPYSNFVCPACGSALVVDDIVIPGMNVYAECRCTHCALSFFQMLPTGHFVNVPMTVGKTDLHIYNGTHEYEWLSKIVAESFPLRKGPVELRKIVYKPCTEVIILNALDFLYGHSLLKLFNAQHHLDRETGPGLVVILPKILEWMIPEGCAEAWIVDLSLRELEKSYESIAQFVSGQLDRFNKVWISRAYSHPDFKSVDIERFTGIKPFNLREFNNLKPSITFVLREDRWWLGNPIDYWFYRFCRKLKWLKTANKILSKRQNGLVKKTIAGIRKKLPDATFNIVGLGATGRFHGFVNDRRTLKMDAASEKEWCAIYSRSHVVIGFHGSNMLLPTAFAAGCVEILPEDRYGNIVQDISVRYSDRQQLFFYRFVQQYADPRSVARHAIAMVRHYDHFYRNMCSNVYGSE